MNEQTVCIQTREEMEQVNELLARALPELLDRMTDIRLERGASGGAEEVWATVYTLVEGDLPLILAMQAPYLLLKRAARNFTGDLCTEEDVAECATEFFNVFCGHVTARIYGRLGRSAMLYPPRVVAGAFFPNVSEERVGELRFDSGGTGGVVIRWASPAGGLPFEELDIFRRREI